ncbi:MAG: hypothetical protein HC923_07665 [Myxococcales bacterium]|nr:hypothetical protein [Myxococcales bacterium]
MCTGRRKKTPDGSFVDWVFARQAMRAPKKTALSAAPIARSLQEALSARKTSFSDEWTFGLQVVAPDSKDPRDPRRPIAEEIEASLAEPSWCPPELRSSIVSWDRAFDLLQVWIVDEQSASSRSPPSKRPCRLPPAESST